jgi:predicted RNase H-like HicB family nuclease
VNELVFEVTEDSEGGYTAECLTENIFTQGDSWDELRANVKDAVAAFYFDKPSPDRVRLHLVRDEMFALR